MTPIAKPFTIEEYVRWSDVDAAGIVCYGAYVRFVEIAETELFRAAGIPYGKVFDDFDIWLPRVHFSADFHAPARLDEKLKVSAGVKALGRTSLTLAFWIDDHTGRRIAEFEVVLVCIGRADFAKRSLPPGLKTALSAYQV
jgi:YbgC/YbaW family acyl-CoA thioester hydrolase